MNHVVFNIHGKNLILENSVRAVMSREICSCPFFVAFGQSVQKRKGAEYFIEDEVFE